MVFQAQVTISKDPRAPIQVQDHKDHLVPIQEAQGLKALPLVIPGLQVPKVHPLATLAVQAHKGHP